MKSLEVKLPFLFYSFKSGFQQKCVLPVLQGGPHYGEMQRMALLFVMPVE